MIDSDLDLSRLETNTRFDRGSSSTMAIGLTQPVVSPTSLLVESLIEQICKLMEKDPKNQRSLYLTVCAKLQKINLIDSTYKVDEFQFMRSQYQKALYKLLLVARKTMIENKAICSSIYSVDSHINVCTEHLQEPSRYMTEFIQLDFIAKGGFGSVFKVQHKLDGGIYAVKKIFLRYRNLNSFNNNIMEVKMLARLNHPNIVSYKAAWLEPADICTFNEYYDTPSILQSSRASSSISVQIIETETSVKDSFEVVFERSNLTGEMLSISQPSEKLYSQEVIPKSRHNFFKKRKGKKNECAILFIQMQYCYHTLRQWIDNRNHSGSLVDMNLCFQMFKQIACGLQYIHSQNIVHHDIKPSNIFVSEDESDLKLGDFGLACGLIHGTHCGILNNLETESIQETLHSHRPGRIGTELYAAPEQLTGYCHAKSDIYSVGIVLLELMLPFHTSMERIKVIGKLKLGEISAELTSTHPQLVKLLKDMVNEDCSKRPSASELLSSLEELENLNTQKRIKELEHLNQTLREENMEKDLRIAFLEDQLQKLKCLEKT